MKKRKQEHVPLNTVVERALDNIKDNIDKETNNDCLVNDNILHNKEKPFKKTTYGTQYNAAPVLQSYFNI